MIPGQVSRAAAVRWFVFCLGSRGGGGERHNGQELQIAMCTACNVALGVQMVSEDHMVNHKCAATVAMWGWWGCNPFASNRKRGVDGSRAREQFAGSSGARCSN